MKKLFAGILFLLLLSLPGYAWGANWTVMVYMAADNNLESAAINDFLELSSIGSSGEVNIVVQLDRGGHDSSYGGWTTANRFYITQGMEPTLNNAILDWGDGQGGREVDMGDPEVLKDFVSWAMSNYPANHYLLVIWNHGQGWKGKDQRKGFLPLKWVCLDETSNDVLWAYELRNALEGMNLNIVAMDACLMATIEIMSELNGIANYYVASEETIPFNGYPYDDIMSVLVSSPTMTPEELCQTIVEKYRDSYMSSSFSITLSAFNMSKFSDLLNALNDLTNEILSSSGWNTLMDARSRVQSFYGNYEIDLHHLAVLLEGNFSKASEVKEAIENGIVAEYHSSSLTGAYGVSIYFPSGREYNPFYDDPRRSFTNDSSWDDLLRSYFEETAPSLNAPWSDNKPDIDGSIGSEEWSDAAVIENGSVKLYLKCDERYLYIAVDDPADPQVNEGDKVGIYFDTNGDWKWPSVKGNEGNYWIKSTDGTWQGLFRAIWGSVGMPNYDETPTTVSSDELAFAVSTSSGHLQYEVRIDYTARWNVHLEDEVHLYIFVYDAGGNKDDIDWPADLTGSDFGYFSPVNYAKLTLGEGGGVPSMQVSPESIDFGEVKIDETESATLTITNVGTGVLNIEASLTGEDSSNFSIFPASLKVLPDESGTITVYFSPEEEGTLDGFVKLETNDPEKNIYYVYIKGKGKKDENNDIFGGCSASPGKENLPLLLLLVPLLIALRSRLNKPPCP
ncbi:MAG: choice-of-anchor D domain-containing protein [Synergistetes bacterium]|nr:choice-of-anchor D domain-containing protein [Synergistota bacterium]